MSTTTLERPRSAPARSSTAMKDHGQKPKLDLGKVVINPLPRRNDDIYMRTLRRRRS